MLRRKSVKVVLTAVAIASTLPAPDARAADRDLVVSVLDQKGMPVGTLAPQDLIVREDGMAREVLRVRKATAPLTIALLVDDSTAATPAIADMRTGLTAFIDALGPKHQVALSTFGDRSTAVVDYTREKERIKQGISRLFARTGAGAYFLDGITDVARGLEKRAPERAVIVAVMTEGVEFSNRSHQTVLERLYASGARFHALVLSGAEASPLAEETRNRNIVLDEGTRGTGGRREQLLASMALAGALKELVAELENQWIVTYARPDALIPPERLQVEAKREGLVVRAPTRITPVKATQ